MYNCTTKSSKAGSIKRATTLEGEILDFSHALMMSTSKISTKRKLNCTDGVETTLAINYSNKNEGMTHNDHNGMTQGRLKLPIAHLAASWLNFPP